MRDALIARFNFFLRARFFYCSLSIWLGLLILVNPVSSFETIGFESRPNFTTTEVTLTDDNGNTHLFFVEIASSPKEHLFGLMYSSPLPPGRGMLFLFNRLEKRKFWMKNTPISLDILFFDDRGRVVNIHQNTKPLSLRHYESERPSQFVLELGGGEVSRLGITNNFRLRLPILEQINERN